MRIPKAVEKLIESFQRLPGIGPKTAQRLTFYLLFVPQSELDDFAANLTSLKKNTVLCTACFNIGDRNPCEVCSDTTRDKSIICVVEDPLDVIAIEKSGKYNGLYHVLHGIIDPLNSMGPDDIYIPQLISRLRVSFADLRSAEGSGKGRVVTKAEQGFEGQVVTKEVILATNPTMEGEATPKNVYRSPRSTSSLSRSASTGQAVIKEIILATNPTMEGEATAMFIQREIKAINLEIKITRIGRGLPIGADLEYADETTLQRALEGRREY